MEKFDNITSGFRLDKKEYVEDMHGICYTFEHIKSGARLIYVDNDDDNRVFFIAFKTPPLDSCGTAHIMEHSVLCGSEKYKAKDPFNELAKGSLNTYLNALTYSDKTMYPVASRNEKDFENLMSVYIDAVFAPVVLKEKKIFMQEGWHYELDSEDDDLKYKGVVYNEMKGAYSSPDRTLNALVDKSLFGNTTYGFESGGYPENIPDLTYENFKDFYKKYYHPSNSCIYFYGQTDIKKHMEMLDREYLSKYEKTKVNSDIKEVKEPYSRFEKGKYSIPVGTKRENDTMFALNFVTGKATDLLMCASMDVLSYILLDTNASPVKRALIESGICEEADGWHDDSTYQCVMSIEGKGCKSSDKDKFVEVTENALKEAAEKGLDKKLVLSALNYWEFAIKEADYGYRPKGLAYGMSMMKGVLHGGDAAECLRTEKFFDIMRKEAENGYFEKLIKENILENNFKTLVMLEAEEGMQAEHDKKTAEKLKAIKESFSKEEKEKIIEETKELKKYQSEGDSEEIISQIPLLSREDIDKEKKYDIIKEEKGRLIFNTETNGIVYMKVIFKADKLEKEELLYTGLLKNAIASLDTENFDYNSLPSEINLYTGGIDAECISFADNEKRFIPAFAVNGKALERNLGKLFELMNEVIFNTKYDKTESLTKILRELKSSLERKFDESGHSVSSLRALSCCKNSAAYTDMTSGIAFYDFILKAEKNIEETAEKLKETAEKLFAKENFIFAFASDEKNEKEIFEGAEKLENSLSDKTGEIQKYSIINTMKTQAVTTSSKVVYNSIAADFKAFGAEYSGKMRVIKNIVNTEYLWNEVRVRGGAYGCGCNILRNGGIYTYSYRDPNVENTYNAYKNIGEFLRNIKISKRDMTKYILGAINELDRPQSMQTRFDSAVSAYLNGITLEKKQKERNELISVTEDEVASFGEIFDKAYKADIKFTLGNESAAKKAEALFEEIRGLKN